MKDIAILIPNYNSYEAIQLCIESVRKYTRHPYQIIVYDGGSDNKCDLEYLRKAKGDGWIELIEAGEYKIHGQALNFLLNERCKSEFDFAVVLDDDIWIKEKGWLEDMLKEVEKEGILAVCNYLRDKVYYHMDVYRVCFIVFDLKVYRDNMQVDWIPSSGDSRDEIYKTIMKGKKPLTMPMVDPHYIVNDVGSKLLLKILSENPKGYKVSPLPEEVKRKYKHWEKMSHDLWSTMKIGAMGEWLEKALEVNKALEETRA